MGSFEWFRPHALIDHVRRLDERIFPEESEAPLDWILDLTRTPTVHMQAGLSLVLALQGVVAVMNGFIETAMVTFCGSLVFFISWFLQRSGRLSNRHSHALLIFVCVFNSWFLHLCIGYVPSALFVHRSCGLLAVFWRLVLPYYTLHMRPGILCVAALTMMERVTTIHLLVQFGHTAAEVTRVLTILMVLSCATPVWCYANSFMWHALWSTQVQLAAEKESSKSLLSMVCDATFWLSRDGDTILKSTRQFDAIVGQSAELSHLSQHIPESENSRLDTALSSRRLTSLPTSIMRDGIAINVDLFIVPGRPLADKGKQVADPLESLGTLVGLTVSQSFVDSAEARLAPKDPWETTSTQSEGIAADAVQQQTDEMPPDGVRQRRGVAFSDSEFPSNVQSTPAAHAPSDRERLSAFAKHHGIATYGSSEPDSPGMDRELAPLSESEHFTDPLIIATKVGELPARRPESSASSEASFQYTQSSVSSKHTLRSNRFTISTGERATQTELAERVTSSCASTQTERIAQPKPPMSSSPRPEDLQSFLDKHVRYGDRLKKRLDKRAVPLCEKAGSGIPGAASQRGSASAPQRSSSAPQRSRSSRRSSEAAVPPGEMVFPLGPPFVPSTKKLKNVILYLLDDLLSSLNVPITSCCFWHSGVAAIESLLQQLSARHTCSDRWLPFRAAQCGRCSALLQENNDTNCWLCLP